MIGLYATWLQDLTMSYSDMIVGMWMGHCHDDHIEVMYEPSELGAKPYGVAYATPSVSTYMGNDYGFNPSFRVFEMSRSTHKIVNIHTFRMNIDDANKSGTPHWYVMMHEL